MEIHHSPTSACLILVYPGDALPTEQSGHHYILFPQGTFVGSRSEDHITVTLPADERRQVQIIYEEDGFWHMYNRLPEKKHRIYVNAMVSNEHILEDGDLIEIGSAVFKFWREGSVDANLYQSLNKQVQEEKHRAETDFLMQILNKDALEKSIAQEVSYSRRKQKPLCLIIMDVDAFRTINEKYGHPGGDQILAQLAHRIHEKKRLEDIFGRFGGEELVMLLRDTPLEEALLLAERIRVFIADTPFTFEEHVVPLTISLGVALFTNEMDDKGVQLVKKADQYLYQAKRQGKNQVCGDKPQT